MGCRNNSTVMRLQNVNGRVPPAGGRTIICDDCPAIQLLPMLVFCVAERSTRFTCFIMITLKDEIKTRMVLHQPVESTELIGIYLQVCGGKDRHTNK